MKIFVYRHGFYVSGKVKDVRRLLRQYALEFTTVRELVNNRLN